ncbi:MULTISPECIES: hypothetical protein [Sphingobium]|uniref:hypothetical protein n=1 Tax=Sphingobium TaxID=165695 RepID=UPI0011AE6966|nr:hypothetical protein [Sphingobium sp. YG1]
MRTTLAIYIIASLLLPNTASAQWVPGQEREVDEGVYAKIISQQNGWRIWRFETKDDVTCQAVKSARGRPHPVPVGFRDKMYMGTPFISISRGYKDEASVDLHGKYGYSQTWRRLGNKFWNEKLGLNDLSLNDGDPIEVHTETWEYPQIRVGLTSESGIVDLTGILAAVDALKECDQKIIMPFLRKKGGAWLEKIEPVPTVADVPPGVSLSFDGVKVEYEATVNLEGRASTCVITRSSGIAALDQKTCELIMSRAQFTVARSLAGQAMVGKFAGKFTWSS